MNLLIKIKDGQPIDHPIAEENLRHFFPDLDIENPPDGFAKFIRKPYPVLKEFEKIDSIEYVIDENHWPSNLPVYTDQYNIRTMTDEEMIDMADEQTKSMNRKMEVLANAPYSAPDDGNLYVWSGSSNSWVLKPDNFDEALSKFINKLKELGLSGLTPEQLNNIDPGKKQQLEQIVNELNTNEGFKVFDI